MCDIIIRNNGLDTAAVGDFESMIKNVTTINEYEGYINSFLDDSEFSDPHLTARIEPAINLYESMGFIKKESGNLLTAYWDAL